MTGTAARLCTRGRSAETSRRTRRARQRPPLPEPCNPCFYRPTARVLRLTSCHEITETNRDIYTDFFDRNLAGCDVVCKNATPDGRAAHRSRTEPTWFWRASR